MKRVLFVLLAFALAGCASPTPEPTASPTPTLTATATSTPTNTPTPTSTPTPSPFSGPLPADASLRLGKGTLNSFAVSPDGAQLVVGTGLGVYAYDTDAFDEWWFYDAPVSVSDVAYAPDGSRLAAALVDGTIAMLDPATGEETASLDVDRSVNDMAWSPDSSRLVTAHDNGNLQVWTATDGEGTEAGTLLYTLSGSDANVPVSAVGWSPDGRWIASAATNVFVIIWNAETGGRQRTLRISNWLFPGVGFPVSTVAFSPDSALLAIDGVQLWIYDVATGQQVENRLLYGLPDATVDWTPDGGELAIGTRYVWDRDAERVNERENNLGTLNRVAYSPDGELLYAAHPEGSVYVMDSANDSAAPRLIADGFTNGVFGLDWSPDGRWLSTATIAERVVIWDVEHQVPVDTIQVHSLAWSTAWSPDGTRLAAGTNHGHFMVWDIRDTGQGLEHSEVHDVLAYQGFGVVSLAWSPDGTALATAGEGGQVTLWDMETGEARYALENLGGQASLAWSPDGSQLAAGIWDGEVVLLDATTGETLHTLLESEAAAISVDWSPDGRWLGCAMGDGTTVVLDGATGEQAALLRKPESEAGEALPELIRNFAALSSVDWSPDGTRLAAGAWDYSVLVWDVSAIESGGEVSPEPENVMWGHKGIPWTVAWSPDGSTLASGSLDGSIVLWTVGQP